MTAMLAFLLVAPGFADDDGNAGRWDPTGTYYAVTEEDAPGIPAGTVFTMHVWRIDRPGNHFMFRTERVNNMLGKMPIFTGEMWRTGPNSVKWTLVGYDVDEDLNLVTSFVGSGRTVREMNGEVWQRDAYYWYYFGNQDPLDPNEVPFWEGPADDAKFSHVLEYRSPPES